MVCAYFGLVNRKNSVAVATSILRTRHDNCKMFSDNF